MPPTLVADLLAVLGHDHLQGGLVLLQERAQLRVVMLQLLDVAELDVGQPHSALLPSVQLLDALPILQQKQHSCVSRLATTEEPYKD